MTEPLPPHYYLTNFRLLLDWVADHHSDLLNDEELHFIRTFTLLDRDSQCLLVRMIGRKGQWFRTSKLQYAEIDDHAAAANRLLASGFISCDAPLSLLELADLVTKPELLQLFDEHLRPYKSQRKDVLIDILKENYTTRLNWSTWMRDRLDKIYRLEVQHISDTLMLLFFGNSYQDLTEFVLQDLGLFQYEKYAIDKQHRIFKNRKEISQYQQLLVLRDQLAEASDIESLKQLLPNLPNAFTSATMERRRARLFNQLAYEFERCGELPTALELYQAVNLPPSRERQVRLLEKLGKIDCAWQLLTTILAQPANEHELQIAERMAPRLAKKIRVPFVKKIPVRGLDNRITLPRLTNESGEALRVEDIARLHFHEDKTPCLYMENLLVNGLFGLWLWPEMFRSIDGAFANPFQSAPLDLYQEDFQKNRPELEKLWQLLDEQQHHAHIKKIWTEKFGLANHFVHWQQALDCIPARHLTLIFQRLLFDLKANRSGLPDLIQFFPEQSRYRMIEIKGPGDRIQDNQQRWLDYFNTHSIPAEVVYVSWQ
jgi:hypothetical protein